MMKWTDLVQKTKLPNTINNWGISTIDPSMVTSDYVYIDSIEELSPKQYIKLGTPITYYSLVNCGRYAKKIYWDETVDPTTSIALRNTSGPNYNRSLTYDGGIYYVQGMQRSAGLSPAMRLNLKTFLTYQTKYPGFGKLGIIENIEGEVVAHSIEMGEYPQTKVSIKEKNKLNKLLSTGQLTKTGKQYMGRLEEHFYPSPVYIMHDEYEMDGQKYVLVRTIRADIPNATWNEPPSMVINFDAYEWVKVDPLAWIIKNWDDMPISLNPEGNGTAKYIDIRTAKAIQTGIPFHTIRGNGTRPHNFFLPDERTIPIGKENLWQNSMIRAFLNGYNIYKELESGNGKKSYKANINYNFEGKSFMNTLFDNMELLYTQNRQR